MIRDYVLAWASILLVAMLAFILMPSYERFKDEEGREVDVDPNAPPMPEWLKSKDPRKETFQTNVPVSVTTQPSSPSQVAAQTIRLPPPPPIPQGAPPKNDPDYPKFKQFCNLCSGDAIDAFFKIFMTPAEQDPRVISMFKADPDWASWGRQMCSICKLDEFSGPIPPPSSTESNVPSGVNVLASKSMPNNPLMDSVGANTGLDKKVITRTLPGPRFDDPMAIDSGYGDKYVLKSSLVPCATGSCSRVPGGNDGMVPSAGGSGFPNDGISKPFSAAFSNQNEPQGFLNSFAAFMK